MRLSAALYEGRSSRDVRYALQAPQGQRIRISSYDFSSERPAAAAVKRRCPVYAVIEEASAVVRAQLCERRRRLQQVYMSLTSRVEIRFVRQWPLNGMNLLFRYECKSSSVFTNVSVQTWQRSSIQ